MTFLNLARNIIKNMYLTLTLLYIMYIYLQEFDISIAFKTVHLIFHSCQKHVAELILNKLILVFD